MTVSEAVIEWLKTFDIEEYRNIKHIDTDIQSAEVGTYALVKEPVQNVKSYMSGRKIYTDHYMIQARLPSNGNSDRIENNGFGEALEDWVREKNDKKEFPDCQGKKVHEISVTTPFYAGKTETNNIVYQMTVAIKYEKE